MGEAQQEQETLNDLEAVLTSQDIPQLYVNGFTTVISNTDICTVLERNGSPVAVLNISYTTAKSLAQKLSQLIADFETIAQHPLMTIEDVNSTLAQLKKGKP